MKEIPISYEPILSEETMYLHYDKLYKGYQDRFKKLAGDEEPLQAVLNIEKYPLERRGNILYNAGGIINHEMYFEEINKNGRHEPGGNLKKAIDQQYGSYEQLKMKIKEIARLLVGSGYTFLVLNNKQLDIVNMSNQETPYFYDMVPILNIDLWEHSYYLDYKTDRNAYVDAFFELLDFDVIDKRYDQAATKN